MTTERLPQAPARNTPEAPPLDVIAERIEEALARLREARPILDARIGRAATILVVHLSSPPRSRPIRCRVRRGGKRVLLVKSLSSGGAVYQVDPHDFTCSCPDFHRAGAGCKHGIAAWALWRSSLPREVGEHLDRLEEINDRIKEAAHDHQEEEEEGCGTCARALIANNRAPSKVKDHEYHLSRGFLFCADCGRAMVSYARRFPTRAHHYYRCDAERKTRGTAAPCPNRRSHEAHGLEYLAASTFEAHASHNSLLRLYDEAVARREEQTGGRDDLERRAALSKRLSDLELERRGYLRQNARGVLPDADLDAMLVDVDEQRETMEAEIRASEDRAAEAERLREARGSLAAYDPVHAGWFGDSDAVVPWRFLTQDQGATTEEIRNAYRRLGARFEVDAGGELTLRLELDLGGAALQPTSSRS